MRVDIHVHTGRYSGCAVGSPQEMAQAALAKGLEGIVLAEHDMAWPQGELANLAKEFPGLRFFRGAEMTVAQGEHLLVLGVSTFAPLVPLLPYRQLIELVRDLGGIAILAHPLRRDPDPELLKLVDGVEVASHSIPQALRAKVTALASQYQLPAMAASDAHWPQALGQFAMDILSPVETEQELAAALAHGCFRNYIDPTFTSMKDEFYRDWKIIQT